MLLSFAATNHRSIQGELVLNLEATADTHLEDSRVIGKGDQRVLRSALIYGPNGSGKSNVLKAMQTMLRILFSAASSGESVSPVGRRLPVEPFLLSTEGPLLPSAFHVRFLTDGATYSYGFEVTATEVRHEYLKRKGQGREVVLFEREGAELDIGPQFPEGKERQKFLRPNALFLSLCAELNGEVSAGVMRWFQRITIMEGLTAEHLSDTFEMLRHSEQGALLADMARRADFGIRGLGLREFDPAAIRLPDAFPQEVRERELRRIALLNTDIATTHQRFGPDGQPVDEVQLSLRHHASSGTSRFLTLVAPLVRAMRRDAILFVDEIEARLHPVLMRELFEWFHAEARPGRSQLVACTHDVLLMDPEFVRRDQVWFAEKGEHGATTLTCLAEYDASEVRPSTKFGRRYLMGVFGALPHPRLIEPRD